MPPDTAETASVETRRVLSEEELAGLVSRDSMIGTALADAPAA